ncbi:MAG TPA: hypothetical protein IAC48_05455 [Candidatus Limiplasma stercoravium]|nr:hypothetical protein [Candidatus Limiplasma stercoravium]
MTESAHLDLLASSLSIRMAELSRALNFDPSYVSRIRLGKRQPADAPAFAQGVGRFVTRRFASCAARAELAEILNLPVEALAEDDACAGALTAWLLGKET